MQYKSREEVPNKYKWDLSSRFKDFGEWEKHYEELEERIKAFSKYKENVISNADQLYEALEYYYDCEKEVVRILCYASLRLDENLSDKDNLNFYQKSEKLSSLFGVETAFWESELMKLTKELLMEYIKVCPKLEK